MPPRDDEVEDWPLGRLLSSAARLVEHAWNAHLGAWGLTHASIPVLHLLRAGPLSQRELAALVGVEDQTISRTLDRLEKAGHVERRRDASDRRRVLVTLTDGGAQVLAEAADPRVAEAMVADGLDEEDVAVLRRTLASIVRRRAEDRWAVAPSDPEAARSGAEPADGAA